MLKKLSIIIIVISVVRLAYTEIKHNIKQKANTEIFNTYFQEYEFIPANVYHSTKNSIAHDIFRINYSFEINGVKYNAEALANNCCISEEPCCVICSKQNPKYHVFYPYPYRLIEEKNPQISEAKFIKLISNTKQLK